MTNFAITPSASGTGTVTLTVAEINTVNTVALPVISGGTLLENTNPTVNQLNGGQLAGFRNKIINGKMDIAQRGTTLSGLSASPTSTYHLDRYRIGGVGTSAFITITQQTDVPTNNEFVNSLRIAVTTADNSIGSGEVSLLDQVIEGYNARDLIGRTFTLSFWVRSSKTGIHCISFRNTNIDRSYVVEYTVNAANTWEKKSITVSGGLITTGTWDWTTGQGLQVAWTLAAGSNFQTTAGTWQTGNFLATANQTNCLDTIGNIFAITGVQLEVGTVATPFEHRPFSTELALCQRYFCKTYNQNVGPGSVSAAGAVWSAVPITTNYANIGTWNFPVTMRTTPTITVYNPFTGVIGSFAGDSFNYSPVGVSAIGERSVSFFGNNVQIGTHVFVSCQAIASAEL